MEKIKGLSHAQVEKAREESGCNKLSEKEKITLWQKYWEKFDDPIIIVLLIALGINIVFTFLGKVDWFECAGIFVSILIATCVSALSEYRNEETFRKIQSEASKILCKVYRDGNLSEVMIDDIVKGDFVLLQAGDIVPADGSVFRGSIKVDQSALNGENREVLKTPFENPPQYRTRLVDFWDESSLYRGGIVCSGQCIMEVGQVGDKTVYGRLSKETEDKDRKSPLQVKLTDLAKWISGFGYIGAALVTAVYIIKNFFVENGWNVYQITEYFSDGAQVISDVVSSIIVGITVVVMAVPEGLPLMVAIVCSLNMKKMMKSNVLVRKLIGIETAGSINMLFTDKTGTITCGKLSVTEFVDGEGNTYDRKENIPNFLKKMIDISVLGNCAAQMSKGKVVGGNATEKALMEFVYQGKKPSVTLEKVRETLFSSETKFSQTQVRGDFQGALIKGAPEKILKNCNSFFDVTGEKQNFRSMTSLYKIIDEMASRSIRVLALAVCETYVDGGIPQNMTLLGLVGIRDDLRPDVVASVREVKRAGIKTIMITGDKKETAVAIAKEAEILDSSRNIVLTSEDLQRMSDDEVSEILPELRVVARALPTDKSRLVRIAQEKGLVVGMTGDGVNDLAALRRADVGFAMGSGADVAKEAGDIVILDDNFSSVRSAVLFGRTIYKSIKKFIVFQMTINIAAVLVSAFGPLVGIDRPLGITQMLWVNLVMDTLGAIAFGGEGALKKYMLDRPKKREEKILDKRAWSQVAISGMFIFAMSMFMFLSKDVHYAFRQAENDVVFYTGFFNFFVFAGTINAFNVRCDGIDLIENISLNKPFLIIMCLIMAVQIFMTYFGGAVLRTAPLDPHEWVAAVIPALLIIPLDLTRKIIFGKK
ncbi:MAG: calcium-translocating P-type ATPase, PMCA-type [Clostridia bacterium]|nr:calcium-translocating P-type ATPase, PMCA-type [Clostridia bacterium]